MDLFSHERDALFQIQIHKFLDLRAKQKFLFAGISMLLPIGSNDLIRKAVRRWIARSAYI